MEQTKCKNLRKKSYYATLSEEKKDENGVKERQKQKKRVAQKLLIENTKHLASINSYTDFGDQVYMYDVIIYFYLLTTYLLGTLREQEDKFSTISQYQQRIKKKKYQYSTLSNEKKRGNAQKTKTKKKGILKNSLDQLSTLSLQHPLDNIN